MNNSLEKVCKQYPINGIYYFPVFIRSVEPAFIKMKIKPIVFIAFKGADNHGIGYMRSMSQMKDSKQGFWICEVAIGLF